MAENVDKRCHSGFDEVRAQHGGIAALGKYTCQAHGSSCGFPHR